MAKVIGKEPLCSTDLKYFKAIQIIEGQTLFDRYKSAQATIDNYIDLKYRHFISYPVKEGDKITFHGKRYNETSQILSDLQGEEAAKYQRLKAETLDHYNSKIEELKNSGKTIEAKFLTAAIKYVDDRFVYCYDNTVVLGVWGMQLRENLREDIHEIRKDLTEVPPPLPPPPPPPLPPPPPSFTITYNAGDNGTLNGDAKIDKQQNEILTDSDIPQIEPKEGYEFTGWDIDPHGHKVTGDVQFTAQYRKKVVEKKPWWKRFWLWFTRKGCLQWLLWLLLLLLLLLLLCWLLRSCDGPPPPKGNPYTPVPTPPGYEDVLPPQQGVLPPINDDDEAEIIPGNPTIIGNRLNILMENENKSIMDLAKAFKVKYPDDKYKVIYYDNVVKRMQITIPPEERERLKQEIPPAFAPEYELFVFDEALFESSYIPNDPAFYDSDKSWYLDAIHAPQAWDITRGSPKLTVAIVDNGFNLSHPELKRKVVMPYNVWTHSTGVFPQQVDHGTHVAGIALAIADNWKGICGIAPNCAFMPVQVADANERMTTTSVLDGILYALYQGADVVNVSLGGQFTGLDRYPESTQQDLIRNYFKEEERLWHEVMRIAAKHNSTIVVAAGNDNALAGIDPIQRPALAVTVSAVDKNNRNLNKADFSNYGYYSTISAPGVGIYSSIGENGYQMADGTSMAAPIVSGAIALMKSLNNSLTTQQIICILQNTGLKTQGNIGKLIQLDKALEMVKSGEKIDCTPLPSTGDVQILLSWNNYNDLDLCCIDPQGDTVCFKNPRTPSGGQLEFDMNVEYPYSKTPVENIYWQPCSAPNGTYNVYLIYYRQHEPAIDETPYHIKVKYGEKNEDYSGVIQRADNSIHICSFTLGTATNNPVNPIAAGIGQNQ
ncbi:MAG: S8 family serine peptidase [Dysgonamonadaceae bacterium]|jgi:subtilisin family serine protease|nr:S8 family serine peptidase [Dysgonamonadaceae bacterium]